MTTFYSPEKFFELPGDPGFRGQIICPGNSIPTAAAINLQGMLSLAPLRSLQQKQETPQAMTIIRMTETHPTMSNNFKLI